MKRYWEVYYIKANGFAVYMPCETKTKAMKEAKSLAKEADIEWVEIHAHNDEEILDDTIEVVKKNIRG